MKNVKKNLNQCSTGTNKRDVKMVRKNWANLLFGQKSTGSKIMLIIGTGT